MRSWSSTRAVSSSAAAMPNCATRAASTNACSTCKMGCWPIRRHRQRKLRRDQGHGCRLKRDKGRLMNDSTLVSRLQFAFTIAYHYLFPQLTMGLALLMVILKVLYLRRGDERFN